MITLTSKQTQIRMIFVSLLLGLILALWPKPSFSQTRRFARTGGDCPGDRQGNGSGRDGCRRNPQQLEEHRTRCAAIHPLYLAMGR